MTKPNAIILEIDGVLSDDRERQHLIDPSLKKDGFYQVFSSLEQKAGWYYYDDVSHPKRCVRIALNYAAYHAAFQSDLLNESIAQILWQMDATVFLFVTDRPHEFYRETQQWLLDNDCFNQGDCIFMRPEFTQHSCCGCKVLENHRPPNEIKREIYETKIKDNYNVLFVIERDDECCEMYKDLGLQVLRVV